MRLRRRVCSFGCLKCEDIVSIAHPTSAAYLDDSTAVDRYREIVDRLSMKASQPSKTPDMQRDLIERLRCGQCRLIARTFRDRDRRHSGAVIGQPPTAFVRMFLEQLASGELHQEAD